MYKRYICFVQKISLFCTRIDQYLRLNWNKNIKTTTINIGLKYHVCGILISIRNSEPLCIQIRFNKKVRTMTLNDFYLQKLLSIIQLNNGLNTKEKTNYSKLLDERMCMH